ncbi:hypothetical protein MHU86_497 [Fragilaria crotonensis]|nr:hypothetical protein MHU86_497 [Fragilaria crotonensis]
MSSDSFQLHAKQKNKAKLRAYIGNLRACPDITAKLLYLLQQKGFVDIGEHDIEVHKQKSCFALVSCSNVDRLIAKINGVDFDGRKLVAQREQKKAGTTKPSFGGGWVGPKKPSPQPIPQSTTKPSQAFSVDEVSDPLRDEEYQSDHQNILTLDSFRSRCQKPLTDLLSEFGEFDPNFKKVIPTLPSAEIGLSSRDSDVGESSNQLGKFGKAPLHVEFCSFGYIFSAPSSKGHIHANPLPSLDCRHLPSVPPYLAHKPGIAFAVKRVLLTDELKATVSTLTAQVMGALIDAIADGHGYAMPLRMTINVGSENGRHRSVLVCEEAAKGLRDRLRKNVNNSVQVEVSVGTTHSDMDRKRDLGRRKPDAADDEW